MELPSFVMPYFTGLMISNKDSIKNLELFIYYMHLFNAFSYAVEKAEGVSGIDPDGSPRYVKIEPYEQHEARELILAAFFKPGAIIKTAHDTRWVVEVTEDGYVIHSEALGKREWHNQDDNVTYRIDQTLEVYEFILSQIKD